MTPEEIMHVDLTLRLKRREKQKSTNLKLAESGITKYDRDSAIAVRRNDKSIALLIAKMLCRHNLTITHGRNFGSKVYCSICRHTATILSHGQNERSLLRRR